MSTQVTVKIERHDIVTVENCFYTRGRLGRWIYARFFEAPQWMADAKYPFHAKSSYVKSSLQLSSITGTRFFGRYLEKYLTPGGERVLHTHTHIVGWKSRI